MASELDGAHIVAAYARWAPVYDAIFGVITNSAISRTMRVLNALSPGRILEIGVGTGLACRATEKSTASPASTSAPTCWRAPARGWRARS